VLVIPVGYVQVTVKFTSGSNHRPGANVYGASHSGTVSPAFADTLSAALAAAYKPFIGETGSYDGIRIIVGAGAEPPTAVESTEDIGPGSSAGHLAPPQVQVLVTKATALVGRRFRGRTFWPDAIEDAIDPNGQLTTTYLSGLQSAADDVMDAFAIAPLTGMVLLHESLPIPAPPPPSPTPVTTFLVSNLCSTQRRRFPRS